MSVPDAALNFLLDNVTQVLSYNYNLIADVRENILKLQGELETLKASMADFSRYNHDSQFLKQTMNEIRNVLGEAEDAVDTYVLQASLQKSRSRVSKVFHQITDYPKVLRDVGKRIEGVGEKVKKINKEKVKSGFEVLQYQAIVDLNRPQNSTEEPVVEEEHVVGFDGAASDVQKLLTQGAEGLEVISIVGMLGLGKTTLARKVFKDPIVDYEFIIQAFVYVSRDYKKAEVLLKILESFMDIRGKENMEERELEKLLYQELEGKQYLIVLDDVWEKSDWDRFKDVFPKNNKRCRILITTRYERVAKHANLKIEPYKLDFLPKDKSRELLRWRVFKDDKGRSEFQEPEVEIAKKCGGLPLAIVVIAGIIVNDPDRVEWWWQVANSAEVYITEDNAETAKLIDLMYKHLPNELKLCFLYLGVFREDFEIPVWKLFRLWIAEGLIQQKGNLNMEDQAEQYLEELAHRNLVMVGQRRSNGKIKTCRMHDTLREFCKTEAAEENMFQEIRKDNLYHFLSGDVKLELHRRLCINNTNVMNYISARPSGGKNVRSFLTFVKEETQLDAKFVSCIPDTFKLLRVLEVESLVFTRFPPALSNLVLLKYIAMHSNFEILPKALSDLRNLQTLIVYTTSSALEIKVDLWKMPHFRHLHTNASTKLPSPSDGSNTTKARKIQTLSTISPESCTREVFERIPEVKKLGIHGKITKESNFFGYLHSLGMLKNLKLLNQDVGSKLYNLPRDIIFPKHLTKLTLLYTFLDWKEMSTLGELQYLEVLKLKDYAFQGSIWDTKKGGFWRLQYLHIGRCDLAVWQASVDHFPVLRILKLIGCDKLEAFPRGLADIPSLRSVILHSTNSNVTSIARKLYIVKLQVEKQDKKTNGFNLYIYPPDQ